MEQSVWRCKGFIAFLFIAFFNAFTDVGHKIIIYNALFKYYDDAEMRVYTSLIQAMILLPFVMVFTPAGFLSDKFPKHKIIRIAALLALPITGFITISYYTGAFWTAFLMTFVLALQSAIYSPAKYGYIRELVGKQKLAPANSAVQAVTIVAILAGTLVYSVIFEALLGTDFNSLSLGEILVAVKYAGFLLVGATLIEVWLSYRLPQKLETDTKLHFDFGKYVRMAYLKQNLGTAWSHQGIWLSIIGLSVFFAVNQVVLAIFGAHLKDSIGEENTVVVNGLMALSGIGIVVGAIAAGKISKNYIETGIVPLGALGMFVGLIGLSFITDRWLLATLFTAYGFFGGLFIVPLNSLIQYHAKQGESGVVIAANNFVQNIFMLTALGISILLAWAQVSSSTVFSLLAATVFIGTLYSVLKLPQSLIRYVITGLINRRYQIEVTGMQNLPVRGGALLLGNHVSWLDWAVLQIASPRPIRFVMTRTYYEKWYIKWILDLFKVIPIGRAGSKKALDNVYEALQRGEVVALFPEGHISQNGHLGVFRSGFERAVQGTAAMIVPFYLRGLWGSRFSYVNGKYRQISRGSGSLRQLGVAFGKPLPADTGAAAVKQAVLETSISAWREYVETLEPLPVSFIRTATSNRRRLCIFEPNNDFTYARLTAAALAFSGKLKPLLENQQTVGLLLPSSAAAVLANLAVLMQGKTAVNLNYTASLDTVAVSMQRAEIQTILSSRQFLKKLEARGMDLNPLQNQAKIVFLEDLKREIPKTALLWAYVQARLFPAWLLIALHIKTVPMESPAAILFSSGSEGVPKGVMLSHANIMANIKQAAVIINADDDDVLLNSLPIFHAFGLTVTSLLPLIEGIPTVCQPDPTDAKGVGRLVAEYKVTLMFATSTFLRIYARNRKLPALMFDSLRLVIAGAERLKPEVRTQFKEKFGKTIYEGYGATETGPVSNVNIPDVLLSYAGEVQIGNKIGTVGMPVPGTRVKIVDPDTLAELPTDEAGLILIGGPQVMPGYLKDPEKTGEALIKEGGMHWYKTGDKGKLDSDGFLTILDRYSRFAKLGGEMVSLGAVEAAVTQLIEDPDIEVLAVALPDEAKGEKVVMLVSGTADTDTLRNKVRESGMNPLMQPKEWYAVEALPKLGTGKADFTGAKRLAAELAG